MEVGSYIYWPKYLCLVSTENRRFVIIEFIAVDPHIRACEFYPFQWTNMFLVFQILEYFHIDSISRTITDVWIIFVACK